MKKGLLGPCSRADLDVRMCTYMPCQRRKREGERWMEGVYVCMCVCVCVFVLCLYEATILGGWGWGWGCWGVS